MELAHFRKSVAWMVILAILVSFLPNLSLRIHASESENPFAGKTISILGDSISTFAGVSNDSAANSTIGGNAVYYNGSRQDISREDTWWQQTADRLGMKLLVNNSWSGSCVLTTRAGTVGSYVDRCVQLHNDHTGEEPDVIAVFLGTNDYYNFPATLGDANIDYASLIRNNGEGTFSYTDPATVCEAYAITLHKMVNRYLEAEIYCMTMLPRRGTASQPTAFNTELAKVIEHFGCYVVDLENCGIGTDPSSFDIYITDKSVHPGPLGMDMMTDALIQSMQENSRYSANHRHRYENGFCTLCNRKNPFAGKYISFVGDSISTFSGVSNNTTYNSTIGSNAVYYPRSDRDVALEDTWWMQTVEALEMELCVNNSWSGSAVLEPRHGVASVGYGNRSVNLHNDITGQEPDIIAIFMGTNDFTFKAGSLGTADINYDDLIHRIQDGSYTYATPKTTCEAYAIMLHKMQIRYPQAEIYCMNLFKRRDPQISNHNPVSGQPTAFNAELEKVIAHFGCVRVDLESLVEPPAEIFDQYFADNVHPKAAGMDLMTEALVEAIQQNSRYGSDHQHNYQAVVTEPTCAEQGYTTYTCACSDSYKDDFVNATGHSYDCIVCTLCGNKYSDENTELDDVFAVTMTPENYLTISNPFTEKLACAPNMVTYGNGNLAVVYLADDVNTVETESSTTIICRLALFDADDPTNGTFFDIATAGQTIGSVTIGSKAPYEPNLLKLSDDLLLVLFNIRDAAGNYAYYSATFDTVSNTVISYQPLTLDGKNWTPANVAASYNALAEKDVSTSGPTSSMVFTSKIVHHEGYYYGYCGGICSGFSGILVRSIDGIHWSSVLVPQALPEMAGVIECGFEFLDNYLYFCMRDISSGVYQCSYNFKTGEQLSRTSKLAGITTSKPTAFTQDGNLYLIVNKVTGDDNTVGRRNTALFYQVNPETCRLTLARQVFCADGVAYHSVVNLDGTNYWSFHTDARRINPYTQGRSNLAFLKIPELYIGENGSADGVLDWNDYSHMLAMGCITAASNTWQASAVNKHYQIPRVDFADFDTVTITANREQKAYIAFFSEWMTEPGTVSYAEGWTEQLIMEPGTVQTLRIPENASYLYILNNNAAGANLLPESVVFSKTETEEHTHSYTTTVTTPSCTEQGFTTYTCACGHSYKDDYVEATGEHRYSAGVCIWCGRNILGDEWLTPDFAQGDYTMILVPDTQILVQSWPEVYQAQMQWIADNKDKMNIQAVLHMGDMVHNNNDTEWTVLKKGTDLIDSAAIPWMPMMGNHDDSAWFNRYYNYETYGTNQTWFGGSYEAGKLDHTYWFVTVGSREYMILSLGWAPTWDVLSWAKGIVEANPGKNVIIACHAYMDKDGSLLGVGDSLSSSSYHPGRPSGEEVWQSFKGYENVVLAMGGHVHSPDIVTYTDQNGAGKTVTSLLIDRQNDDAQNKYAMVAVLTFHNGSNTVDVNWYSTRYDALYRAKNQFSITAAHVCEHEYQSFETEPSCTEAGGIQFTCALCGESYIEEQTPALGHEYTEIKREPTCTEQGYVSLLCQRCGATEKSAYTYDITDAFVWNEGYVISALSGNISADKNWVASDYVEISGYDSIEIVTGDTVNADTTLGLAFYDANKNYISGVLHTDKTGNEYGTLVHNLTVPENAAYIRTTWYSANHDKYNGAQIHNFYCKVTSSYIPAKGHDYEAAATAPNCTEQGFTTYTCGCGHSYVDDYVAAVGHKAEEDKAEEATCTTTGLTAGSHCSVCGVVLKIQETVPAKGHSWDNGTVTKPATETAEGVMTYQCTACGETKTNAIPKLDHTHKYEKVVTEPTCTDQGFTTYTCVCGHNYKDDYVVSIGHKAAEDKPVEATCTKTGLTAGSHCSVCGVVTKAQETVPAKGHSWDNGTVTKPATETAEGVMTYQCTACGETKTASIPKLDHTHKYEKQTTEPACTEQGYTTYTCACGDIYKDAFTDPKGHTPVTDKGREATCTETGLTDGSHCFVCNVVIVKPEVIPAKPHSWKAATCQTPKTCGVCGKTEGDPLVHRWNAATCESPKTCADCGKVEGSALLHWWVDATCQTPKTCKVCGKTEGTVSDHQYLTEMIKPTCTTGGYTTHRCIWCDDTKVTDEVPATGHSFSAWHTYLPATCEEEGVRGRGCACGEVEMEPIPVIDHTYANGKCTVCGHEIRIIVPGDADGDGEVTYLDAMLALQAAVGLTEASLDACDADGDGTITYLDAMLILQAAVGLFILS